MTKPLDKIKKFLEIGKRNSSNDSKMIQTMHDHSVSLGAACDPVTEAADFSTSDAYTLLSKAVAGVVGKDSYPYIADVFDSNLVYSKGYGGELYQCDYDVDESGAVTLGSAVPVVRKVQYIAQSANPLGESTDIEIDGELVPLVESGDPIPLAEAQTRVVKLIAPGWGSSGFYSPDVLKRDGPQLFKAGMQNFIDHPTAIEEKERPEGSIGRLGSVLVEDAVWKDDYKGNGPGLYSKAKITDEFSTFLETFGNDIGMSIRGGGKGRAGEADGRKGFIIEAITAAKSVDYVTVPGAGGKVLELFESLRKPIEPIETKQEGKKPMPDETEITKLQETINGFNRRFVRSEAERYTFRKLATLRVKEAVKDRIVTAVLSDIPMNESGDLDATKFDTLIEAATKHELEYLTSVGGLGEIKGFGSTAPTDVATIEALTKEYDDALAVLDS